MIQCIQQRRSIRKYRSDAIPKEAIEQIIYHCDPVGCVL